MLPRTTIYGVLLCFVMLQAKAQVPDLVYDTAIHNIKLSYASNQLAYPIIQLNGTARLALDFDDLSGDVRNFSYTWQLCDADWSKSILSELDYLKGFTQNRITNYRNSSIALVKYIHYSVALPENNCLPSRSGNYLLKVFTNGDTSNVAFTRRVLVMEEKSSVGGQVQQPFDGQLFKTHQKLVFTVNLSNLNIMNALQQVKVVVLQNNRWDNALTEIKPTFIRQNSLEFNSESIVFPGGREWRWLDLRSFRLQSDRVESAKYNKNSTDIFVKADLDRTPQRLVYYKDYNGMFWNETTESVNYLWQSDYARTHFTFVADGRRELSGKDIYLFGEMTNYGLDPAAKMMYNQDKGVYETSLLLKNGYYSYDYVTIDRQGGPASFEYTEGNLWDTENNYTILVYYRSISGRSDELIGTATLNSLTGRNGN